MSKDQRQLARDLIRQNRDRRQRQTQKSRDATRGEAAEVVVGGFLGLPDKVGAKTRERFEGTFFGPTKDGQLIPKIGVRQVEKLEAKNPGRVRKMIDEAVKDVQHENPIGKVRFKKIGSDERALKIARIRHMKQLVEEYEAKEKEKFKPDKTGVGFKLSEALRNSDTTQKVIGFLVISVFAILMFRFLFFPLFTN
jgi:hypothetical protein